MVSEIPLSIPFAMVLKFLPAKLDAILPLSALAEFALALRLALNSITPPSVTSEFAVILDDVPPVLNPDAAILLLGTATMERESPTRLLAQLILPILAIASNGVEMEIPTTSANVLADLIGLPTLPPRFAISALGIAMAKEKLWTLAMDAIALNRPNGAVPTAIRVFDKILLA